MKNHNNTNRARARDRPNSDFHWSVRVSPVCFPWPGSLSNGRSWSSINCTIPARLSGGSAAGGGLLQNPGTPSSACFGGDAGGEQQAAQFLLRPVQPGAEEHELQS